MRKKILTAFVLVALANLLTALLIYSTGIDITERGSPMFFAVVFHFMATVLPPFWYMIYLD